jgi:uncharacterized coiled-coil DUF342 family protein
MDDSRADYSDNSNHETAKQLKDEALGWHGRASQLEDEIKQLQQVLNERNETIIELTTKIDNLQVELDLLRGEAK